MTHRKRSSGPLAGVRVIDLTQLVAGPNATRTIAALGADVIKIEWQDRLDNIRFNPPIVIPDDPAEWALVLGGVTRDMLPSENRSGLFNDLNAGKRGLGLNLKDEEDREVFAALVASADVVMENFAATTMDRLGLGFGRLREWNPSIVYAQASAFGTLGDRAGFSYGPTAEAESGLTHLSGLPDREPAGWGFAYMDITAGHLMAFAVLAALAQARRTATAVHVDMSQVGSAVFLTGTAILEHSVSNRPTERWGNAGPPDSTGFRGVYRCDGEDDWLAISVSDDATWERLARLLERPERSLADVDPTHAHTWIQDWLRDQERYAAMDLLQRAGVPAGVCQTGRDRVERDQQLQARGFMKPARNREIGWWPVQDLPFRFSRTPAGVGLPGREMDIGHRERRAAPVYDEDGPAIRTEIATRTPRPTIPPRQEPPTNPLAGIRVVELADGAGEFAGHLLRGAGAEVIKVEEPGGSHSRSRGPFGPNGESLYFHQYNLGKRSVVLDLRTQEGQDDVARLLDTADVVIDGSPPGRLDALGIDEARVRRRRPDLIWCAVTPFGRWGPWAGHRADELVHLALGGQMMMCGYDAVEDDDGRRRYDTPPIAPGRHQDAHTAGSQAATAMVAALIERRRSGLGQLIDVSVHEALAIGTEMAVPMWVYGGHEVHRQTARHAWPMPNAPTVFRTSDGRFVYVTSVGSPAMWDRFRSVLLEHGAEPRIGDPDLADMAVRAEPRVAKEIAEIVADFCALHPASDIVAWGQNAGLPWGLVRHPEENADDPHWRVRGLLVDLPAPGGTGEATYVASPWVSAEMPWADPTPAPALGADTLVILDSLRPDSADTRAS